MKETETQVCIVCDGPVLVMVQRNTGLCSILCVKVSSGELSYGKMLELRKGDSLVQA